MGRFGHSERVRREVVAVNAVVWLPLSLYLVELTIKIVALGTVPNNRRTSSSNAWLMLIVVTPILGLAIFLLIGSPFVRGRRAKVQAEANQVITERTAEIPDLPPGADIPVGVDSLFRLNRRLTQLPCVTGGSSLPPVSLASCKTPLIQTHARLGKEPRNSPTHPARIAWRSASSSLGQSATSYTSHLASSARSAGGPAGDG